jgi:microcystin-dependent protein
MADPFVGEIRTFGFNFPPKGWAQCNGQLIPISQNTALFALLGTYYGGDGKSTFALPNLQGSSPMDQGQGQGLSERYIGEVGGEGQLTLLQSEMPAHSHLVSGSGRPANENDPNNSYWGAAVANMYNPTANPPQQMAFQTLGSAGGGLPHNNMQPYLVLNFCIALQGIFPPRS